MRTGTTIRRMMAMTMLAQGFGSGLQTGYADDFEDPIVFHPGPRSGWNIIKRRGGNIQPKKRSNVASIKRQSVKARNVARKTSKKR